MANDLDYTYLAGLIDADGSIMLESRNKSPFRSSTLSLSNTDFELLDFLKETFEGQIVKSKASSENHSLKGEWRLRYRKALDAMQRIYPHMQHTRKRLRVKLLLEEFQSLTPRNGRYTEEMQLAKKDFEDRFLAIKTKFNE